MEVEKIGSWSIMKRGNNTHYAMLHMGYRSVLVSLDRDCVSMERTDKSGGCVCPLSIILRLREIDLP